MKAELRADGLHISGYVNVPGRKSRPILTGSGRAIEIIEQGAFREAIERAGEIRMLQDHRPDRVLARTTDGTLEVKEDAVGLRAESVVSDDEVIEAAKHGKLKGWSFNMRKVQSEMEMRAEGELPLRHVKSFDMDEISLIIDKIPCYSSTSVEYRGEEEEETEIRSSEESVDFLLNDEEKAHIEDRADGTGETDDKQKEDDLWIEEIRLKREIINSLRH